MTESTAAGPQPGQRARAWDALRDPAFRRLCAGTYLDTFGTWTERLAVGWFVLDTSGSVFLAALSFAARSAPSMFLGPFGGAVADRFPRPRILLVTASAKALLMCVLAVFGFAGLDAAWPVLVVVAIGAIARTSEQPTVQALIGDIVGRDRMAAAISLHASGSRFVVLIASAAAGFALQAFGPGLVFLIAASMSALGAASYATLHVAAAAGVGGPERRSLWGDAVEGLRIAVRIPTVMTLLLLAVVIEVFAFSYQALTPALADRVLEVGAAGLGVLTFGASLGGVLGALALTQLIGTVPRGPLLAGVTMVFALSLLGLAVSDRFILSVGLMVAVGAMAAMFDALQWALLQASVPDEVRGRVIGLWITAIGFGWLGPVILGGIAEVAGTTWALAAGGFMALLVAVAAGGSRRIRAL